VSDFTVLSQKDYNDLRAELDQEKQHSRAVERRLNEVLGYLAEAERLLREARDDKSLADELQANGMKPKPARNLTGDEVKAIHLRAHKDAEIERLRAALGQPVPKSEWQRMEARLAEAERLLQTASAWPTQEWIDARAAFLADRETGDG